MGLSRTYVAESPPGSAASRRFASCLGDAGRHTGLHEHLNSTMTSRTDHRPRSELCRAGTGDPGRIRAERVTKLVTSYAISTPGNLSQLEKMLEFLIKQKNVETTHNYMVQSPKIAVPSLKRL